MAAIEIAEYSDEWPKLYELERERLQSVLAHLYPLIEHIGSTAVPGLGAKPIIDIAVGLPRMRDLDKCVEPIVSLGYRYVPEFEDEMPYRRYFRNATDGGWGTHHIHVVKRGQEFWERHLLFRDYLRNHPEAAHEYEMLKRDLASRIEARNAYTDAKTGLIKEIEQRAQQEKRASHPGD